MQDGNGRGFAPVFLARHRRNQTGSGLWPLINGDERGFNSKLGRGSEAFECAPLKTLSKKIV